MLIAIEGVDGAGKTTQLELLAERLRNKGCIITSEPTTTELGEIIRQFLGGHKELAQRTIQLLFVADRSEHVDKLIAPQLKSGRIVVTGRYLFSTIAFGIAAGLDKSWLIALNSKFPMPDATIVLDIDPKVAMERVARRSSYKEIFEKVEFQQKVRKAYLDIKDDNKNYFIVDASKSIEEVSSEISKIVEGITEE